MSSRQTRSSSKDLVSKLNLLTPRGKLKESQSIQAMMKEIQIEMSAEIAGVRSQVEEVRTTQPGIRQSEIQANISPKVSGRDPTLDITPEVRNPFPNNNLSPPKVDLEKWKIYFDGSTFLKSRF